MHRLVAHARAHKLPPLKAVEMSTAMGGYGTYVWAAYGFFAVVVAYNLLQPRLARKRFMKQQKSRLQRENARNTQS